MTQNKKLEIGTSVDTKGIDQLSDRLRKLGSIADDLVSRLKKVKIGSGSRNDDLSNVVKSTTTEMSKLRLESIKTADTLSDRVGRAVLTNTQQIRQQTREFQHAARAARDLGGAVGVAARAGSMVGAGIGFGAGASAGAARGAQAAMANNMTPYGLNAAGGGRGGRGGGGPPWGSTGRWAPYANNPLNQWGPEFGGFDDGMRAAKGTLGFASGAAEMFGRVGKFEGDTATMGLNNLARSQSYRQDLYRLSTSAPVGYGAYILGRGTAFASGKNNGTGDALVDAMVGDGAGRVERDKASSGASIINQLSNDVLAGRAKSAGADMAMTPLNAAGGALDAASSVVKGNFSQAGRNAKNAVGAGFDAATMARNIGSGSLNAESAEAMSSVLSTLQRIAGPQAQMAFGSIQGYAPLLAHSSRMLGGQGRTGMAMGAGAGYDVGSSASVLSGLAQQFGASTTMGGLGKSAFDMSKKGMDAGVAGAIMGQVQMGGGDGQQVLERIFAKGVKQGMDSLDMKFFERIGGAVAEQAITQSGSVSGGNLPEALMFGLKKGSTMADVQGNISGMQMANQMATQNGFFASRSMAMAAEALGPNASGVTIQALNETSPTDLMADKNEYLDNLGIDKKTRQKFGRDRLNMLGNVLGGGAAGDGPEAKRIKAGIEKYGDFATYMQKGGQKERDFAGAVGKSVFGGADYDTFQGMMNFIGGTKQKAGTVKPGESALKDVVDGQAITNIATQTKLVFKQFENVNKILNDIVKGSNGAVKNIGEAYSKLAQATVDMMDKTMTTGSEGYGSSADAAMATAGLVGGMSQLKDVTEDTAAALAKLHGVALAAAANKAPSRNPPAPIKTTPRTMPGKDGGPKF